MRGIRRLVGSGDGTTRLGDAGPMGSIGMGMEDTVRGDSGFRDSEANVLSGETGLVEAVLNTATHHDSECLEAENNLRRAFKARSADRQDDLDNLLNDWRDAITELGAALAPAARARTQQLVPFARQLITTGAIEAMDEQGLDSFMRPIFDDAGIGERFVLRRIADEELSQEPE